jgi:CheY-like chemotaxis protein
MGRAVLAEDFMGNRDNRSNDPAGRLAHRMNNAVAYVLTNLNLISEDLEASEPTERNQKLAQLVVEATSGVTRMGDLIRELKLLSWGGDHQHFQQDEASDDTWDEERRPRRILVVDDKPYILASIRRALRHYNVVVAEGGLQALSLLKDDGNFDLVVCDLVMADASGMDVHRWVATHRPDLSDRLIYMTAGAFTEEVRDFLATVHNPVLHKPFDTKTLRWIIAQALKRAPAGS